MSEPVSLDEAAIISRAKAEAREELIEAQAHDIETAGTRDKAFRALALSVVVVCAIGLPTLALIIGFAVRVFRWAAGY